MFLRNLVIFFLVSVCTQVSAQSLVGKPAFPIQLNDPSGKLITLDSFRGKWVLIDFWASWCPPCRVSNRVVRKHYANWKVNGLEVLGVSIEDNKRQWIAAIKKDKIDWPQVNAPANWDSPLVYQWQLERIPTTYLVDPQGVIKAMNPNPATLLSFISNMDR